MLCSLVIVPARAVTQQQVTFNLTGGSLNGSFYEVDVTATTADGSAFQAVEFQISVSFDKNVLKYARMDDATLPESDEPISEYEGRSQFSVTRPDADGTNNDGTATFTYTDSNVLNHTIPSGTKLGTLKFVVQSGVESCDTVLIIDKSNSKTGYLDDNKQQAVHELGESSGLKISVRGADPTLDVVTITSSSGNQVDGTNGFTAAAAATSVKGTDITGKVSWSVSPAGKGVTIAQDGKITVGAKAKAGTYTITATPGSGVLGSAVNQTLEVTRATPLVPTKINVTADKTALTVPDGTAQLTAEVLDQFDEVMAGQTVSWALDGTPAGVTVDASGHVSLNNTAQGGTVTVKAACGSVEGTINLTITRPASQATSIAIGTYASTAVPKANESDGKRTVNSTVTVKDQFDVEITNPSVTWSIDPAYSGVTIDPASGTITIDKSAAAGNVTVKAAVAGLNPASATLTLTKEAPAAATVAIEGPASLVKPSTGSGNTNYTYSVKVTDQYGADMTVADSAVTWTFTAGAEMTGVTQSGNTLTVTSGAAVDKTGTLTAKVGTVTSAAFTVTVVDIRITWPTCTNTAKTGTYGQTWSQIVGFSAAGGSADLNGNVPGTFTLKDGGVKPAKGNQNYTVVFKSSDGKYTVENQFAATISARNLSNVTITAIPAVTYNGQAQQPAPTVTDSGATIAASDYTVSWANNTNAGTATVTLTATDAGNYTGTKTVNFTINAKPVSDNTITVGAIDGRTYTGSAIVPAVTVKDGEKTLTADTDYTVTGTSVNAGTGSVTITGKGNYGGTRTETFTINRKSVTVTGLTVSEKVYDKTAAATVVTTGATITGKVDTDNLTVASATGTFADVNAADSINVAISGITLGGTASGNYTLDTANSQTSATGKITPKPLTVTNGTLTISKEFDNTTALPTNPAPDFTRLGLTGVLDGDTVTIQGTATAYDSANVGSSHTVSVAVELAGAQKGNYSVTSPYTFTGAVITKVMPTLAQVTGDAAFTAATYDGTAKTITETVGKADVAGLGDISVKYKAAGGGDAAAYVTPTNAGTYYVYACFTEGANYGAKDLKLTHTFTINKAARNLDVTNAALLLYPGHLTASAGVTYADLDKSAVVIYTDAATAVSRSGDSFTAVGNGTMTVKVDIAATDNYNAAAQKTVTITAWANPAEGLTVGTAAPESGSTAGDKVAYTISGSTITVNGIKAEANTLTFDATTPAGRTLDYADGKLTIKAGDVTLAEYTVDDSGVSVIPTINVGDGVDASLALDTGATDSKVAEDAQIDASASPDVTTAIGDTTNNKLAGADSAAAGDLATEAKTVAETKKSDIVAAIDGDVTIKVEVGMKIEATGAVNTPAETSYTVDVKPVYSIVATGAKKGGGSGEMATVVLVGTSNDDGATITPVELPNSKLSKAAITVSVKLPGYLADAVTDGKALFVDHMNGSAVLERLKASVTSGVASWDVTEFSTFKLSVQNETKTVTFTKGDGTTFTQSFDYTNLGQGLPTDTKDGSTFKGWTVGGADYTYVTEDFLSAINTPNPAATAKFEAKTPTTPTDPSNPSNPGSGSTGGSGSSSRDDTVTLRSSSTSHGTVRLSSRDPKRGDTVTITVRPDNGYVVDEVLVYTANGSLLNVRDRGDNEYTFEMPSGTVRVEVTYKLANAPAAQPAFSDVPNTYWAAEAIQWASENGYMMGNSAYTFNPEGRITRQQMWMIMARMAGASPADFTAARSWAIGNNISDGSNPGNSVTRQQMVAILFRYAQLMGFSTSGGTDLTAFPDQGSVASYAQEALQWSVGNGIVGGTADGRLNPGGTATRAQFATILQRFYANVAG